MTEDAKPLVIAVVAQFPLGFFEGGGQGRGGGQAATWLPQLAEAWMDAEGVEIHWLVLDKTVREPGTMRQLNQTFHRIPDRGTSLGLLLARRPQRRGYGRVLREIRPDLVHCWGTETLHGAALWEFEGPSILSMQGVVTTYYETGDLVGWRWKLFRFWEARTMRRATVVTSESQWGLDRVAEIVPGKVMRKIEYGVFPSYYEVEWKPDPERPRILFVGSLNRLKGIDILMEMLRRHRGQKWTMVFVGSGYLEEELRALNHPQVEVRGTLKTGEVQEEMAKSWGFVLPSRADTSPNVIKEARVIGLPIIVSPHGGHAEYVEDGVDGTVVDGEDPEEWFAALEGLCGDFERCRAMGGARRELFREHFRPENTAKEFLALYRELGDKAGGERTVV
ncbi:MAG: glycosyltransferase family 4 protein [Verrucomicrobia bacterium]|nr:glycosyltransferase family 4 protein [Verrucomicrobiota bacterium]